MSISIHGDFPAGLSYQCQFSIPGLNLTTTPATRVDSNTITCDVPLIPTTTPVTATVKVVYNSEVITDEYPFSYTSNICIQT
jgi:hypothetical protein